MLDNVPPKNRIEVDWPASLSRDGGALVSLADLLAALRRSAWIIALCVLVSLTLGAVYLAKTPASYVASAQLMIEAAKQSFIWRDSNVVDLTVDNAQVESQVEVLRSERIINNVIATLGLASDPEFRNDSAASDYARERIAVERFKEALRIRRLGQSYVIEISFWSTDPEKAARIANEVTDAYFRDQLRAKTEAIQQAGEWMQQRVAALGVQLNAAATAVQNFRVANRILDTGGSNQGRLLDKLTELEARAQAYRKLYESFVQRLTEHQQQESYLISNAQVISIAMTPLAKSFPKTLLVLLLALLLGLLVGASIAAARSALDGSVRTAKQLRQFLGLDCLAFLPRFRRSRRRRTAVAPQEHGDPLSPFGNSMRSIGISLQALRDKPNLRLGVISLRPGEGKTTIATGLAALFANAGSKTLLIDADLHHPSLSNRVVPRSNQEAAEIPDNGLEDAIVFDSGTAAYILPLANNPHHCDLAHVLNPSAMQELFQRVQKTFAIVVVDLPALATAADTRAIGPLLDGCIVVVEWGRTPLEQLSEAVELLRSSRVHLFGAVINKVSGGFPSWFGHAAPTGEATVNYSGFHVRSYS
jgi:Mrp family chromosome partitioning ATPase